MSSDATSSDKKSLLVEDLIAQHVLEGNVRCDEEILKSLPDFCKGNAVHETLEGNGLIEEYRIYRKAGDPEITCIASFGDKLNGHSGIVHGGIISTVFDNTFGWLFTILDYPSSFTANLNVNFRKPVMANTAVIVTAKLSESKGRKLFMTAVMRSPSGDVLADATALFITMKAE